MTNVDSSVVQSTAVFLAEYAIGEGEIEIKYREMNHLDFTQNPTFSKQNITATRWILGFWEGACR